MCQIGCVVGYREKIHIGYMREGEIVGIANDSFVLSRCLDLGLGRIQKRNEKGEDFVKV